MKLDIVRVGELRCNCYILEHNGCVLVIDPGDELDKIIDKRGDRDVVGVVVTHHHYDHDGCVNDLVNRYGCIMYDRYNLGEGINKIGNFSFEVIYTPGHKEDLITFYFKEEKWMFCGDFIFKDTIGRCDLPGSNISDMINSLDKIKKYDRDIIIYPGHGIKTTLGYEIDNNIYFRDISFL